MNSMKLLKAADGGAIEKLPLATAVLFNKTPKEAFEGAGEKSKEANNTDAGESSAD